MATRFILTPESAHYPSSNPALLTLVNRRPVLAFDASTDESTFWTGIAPQGLTGTITVIVHYIMASAVTGVVYFQAALEAITPGDAVDLDAGDSFDTTNSGNGSVPATAGYEQTISITMTNADSIAAGDYFRLRLNRDADNASDTAAGDCYVLAVELRDGA
jgi:hypothetical protein